MKTLSISKNIDNPQFYLLIILSIVTLIFPGACGDQSLVTGECEFEEIYIYPEVNSIMINPGEQMDVAVDVTVICNCEDFMDFIIIDKVNNSDYSNVDIMNSGELFNAENNQASGQLALKVAQEADFGTYIIDFSISCEATIGNNGYGKSSTATIQVIVSNGDFSINAPNSFGVVQSLDFTVSCSIERTNNHQDVITLEVPEPPANVTFLIDPNPIPAGVSTFNLTAQASFNAVPGNPLVEIKGNDGVNQHHDIFTLYILEAYYLTLSLQSIEIVQGQVEQITVYNNRIATFLPAINMYAEGDILGVGDEWVTVTFDPNPVSETYCEADIIVGNEVPAGSYQISIFGETGQFLKSTILELLVAE